VTPPERQFNKHGHRRTSSSDVAKLIAMSMTEKEKEKEKEKEAELKKKEEEEAKKRNKDRTSDRSPSTSPLPVSKSPHSNSPLGRNDNVKDTSPNYPATTSSSSSPKLNRNSSFESENNKNVKLTGARKDRGRTLVTDLFVDTKKPPMPPPQESKPRRSSMQSSVLPILDAAPLFNEKYGFWIEKGQRTPIEELFKHSNLTLEDSKTYLSFYRDNFFGKPHINFLGLIDSNPVSVSVRTDNQKEGHLTLVRTKLGDAKLYIPVSMIKTSRLSPKPLPKTILKAISQTYPPLANCGNLQKIKDTPDLEETLCHFETRMMVAGHKIGILYAKEGQVTEEEMFSNVDSSPDFNEFLEFIGTKIELKGWKGYAGGLNVKVDRVSGAGSTGAYSYYTKWNSPEGELEIMFHVSTLLMYQKFDAQQVERKRHLGNDILVIIFQDGNTTPYSPDTIHSFYNQVYFVVRKEVVAGKTFYKLGIAYKHGVPECSPSLSELGLYEKKSDAFREYFLTKLINAERASYRAPSFQDKISQARKVLLKSIIDDYIKK